MREFVTDSPVMAGKKDYFTLCDSMTEFANASHTYDMSSDISWAGGSFSQAQAWACNGKESHVESSDKLLAKLESAIEVSTSRHRTINDVVGQTPNVPAFLAGNVHNMRRRVREFSERAPVRIVIDTSVSAGVGHDKIQLRGAAILALLRILSEKRPVELWAGCGLDAHTSHAAFVFTRIDTAPLDLARAAYALCDPSFPRQLGYGMAAKKYDYVGHWPYNNGALTVEQFRAVLRNAWPDDDCIPCPGFHLNDPLLANPVAWVKARLAECLKEEG